MSPSLRGNAPAPPQCHRALFSLLPKWLATFESGPNGGLINTFLTLSAYER